MADSEQSGQERTLDPTAKRLADARRQGQIPRSRDLAHLLLLGAGCALMFTLSAPLMRSGTEIVGRGLRFDAAALAHPSGMTEHMAGLAATALLALAPLLAVMVVAAIAAPVVVGGWVFSTEALAPKLERMSPIAGVKRLVSLQALVQLVKVLAVVALLGAVGAWYIGSHLQEFASLAGTGLVQGLSRFGWLLGSAVAMLVATLALTSAIDVPFQIFHHRSQLKMTLEEVKREHKETEGDPHIKARIRQQQREVARRRMMAAVPQADVVVTNPTHFAVALKYMEGSHGAPVVVAKGTDAVAEKIKELAAEHRVPQLEAPPLARALHKHVEIGAEIPAALYAAVAQVLAYVYQLKRHAEGRGAHPSEPRDIEVPDGLDPLAPLAKA